MNPGRQFSFILLLALSGVALAQMANDPTRPPSGFEEEGGAALTEAGGGPTLQSVMISPTNKAAIISGVMVRLGEKYGDAVLVKVAESEVVLRSGSESQVLKLYPGLEKQAPGSTAKGARGRAQGSAQPASPR
jgi:MSHA biogenesis protein MshK